MQVTSNKKTGAYTVEVEFKLDANEFEKSLQTTFLKKRGNITIPGFRKGKASRKMIETTYGEGVFYEDSVNSLYREYTPKVVDELGLILVDAPEVEVSEVSKENGVTFNSVFTVRPEGEIDNYKGLEIEISKQEVTEEDVDANLERIQTDSARMIDTSDVPVKNGDIVVFDFEGYCGDKAFEGGSATNFELEIGSGKFIPGFEDQIIDKNVGEDFDVNVTFPEDYPAEELKGKEAVFKCKIHEKTSKELAELDDDFAKDVSEFDTLEELRNDLREKIKKDKENAKDRDIENKIAEKLIPLMEIEIPEVMFENRIDELARDMAYRYNMRPEQLAASSGVPYEQFRNTFRSVSERQVKFRLALEAVASKENIEVSSDDVENEYKKMAEKNNVDEKKVREFIDEDAVIGDIKTERALSIIKDAATIIEKEPSEISDENNNDNNGKD